MLRLGAHITITKGLDKAAELAELIGANTFQFFSRNPRGGTARSVGETEISRWLVLRKEKGIYPLVGHLPYTVNLAAEPGQARDFALMVLTEDLQRLGKMQAEILVCHPGHHNGYPPEAIRRIQDLIALTLENICAPGPNAGPVFCLETMALQGREIGSVEQLGCILKGLGYPTEVGICLDSAHLFAAGWDLTTSQGCDALVKALERQVRLEKVKCLHLNDSAAQLGSHRDRHAGIGEGKLGQEGIIAIVTHPFLGGLPMILETNVADYLDYTSQIALVRQFWKDIW